MFATPILAVSFLLLVVVLFVTPPPGFEEFHRWMTIPGVTTFQPSEVAKFGIVLYLAMHIGEHYKGINSNEVMQIRNFRMSVRVYCFLLYVAIVGAACVLVYLENHVSGALLIFALGLMMMWFAGFDYKIFLFGIVVVVAAAIIVVLNPDILPAHAPRILAWVDKDYDPRGVRWQTNNALYAIGSGGLFGVGLGNSKQKQLYVSEPQNDFIFSIVCEELGVIGAAIIIVLFILLVFLVYENDKFQR